MLIALDFHQCVNYYPDVFTFLTRWLRASGHRVIILSATSPCNGAWLEKDLQHWNIEYDDIIMLDADIQGGYLDFADASEWKQAKMQELGVDLLFDDNPLIPLDNVVVVT